MKVCIHVFLTKLCIGLCTNLFTYVCLSECKYGCTNLIVYITCIGMCGCVYVCLYVRMSACMCVYVSMFVYMYISIYVLV